MLTTFLTFALWVSPVNADDGVAAVPEVADSHGELAGDRPDPARDLYRRGYQFVLEEKWDAAIATLDSVKLIGKSKLMDDALFWKCHVLERTGRKREAFACYARLAKMESSSWSDDAKQSLVQLGSELSLEDDPEHGKYLRALSENLEDEIAATALFALANARDKRGLDAAAALIRKTGDTRIENRLVQVIGQYRSEQAFHHLREIVDGHDDMRTRTAAIWAMSQMQIADREVTQAMATYVESVTLGRYPRRMQSAAMHARVRATAHLSRERDPKAGDFLELVARSHTDKRLRQEATQLLAQLFPSRALALLEILTEDSAKPEMQRQVVRLLAGLADGAGLDRLIQIAEGHQNLTIRKEAIQALQHSRDPKALDALYRLATKPLK